MNIEQAKEIVIAVINDALESIDLKLDLYTKTLRNHRQDKLIMIKLELWMMKNMN
tara:strand:- start:477 stop:641 length:165 start_codon:yes stop_codon:yes gene_type:complete